MLLWASRADLPHVVLDAEHQRPFLRRVCAAGDAERHARRGVVVDRTKAGDGAGAHAAVHRVAPLGQLGVVGDLRLAHRFGPEQREGCVILGADEGRAIVGSRRERIEIHAKQAGIERVHLPCARFVHQTNGARECPGGGARHGEGDARLAAPQLIVVAVGAVVGGATVCERALHAVECLPIQRKLRRCHLRLRLFAHQVVRARVGFGLQHTAEGARRGSRREELDRQDAHAAAGAQQ